MTDQQPSLEEWRALYQAAQAFRAAAPWEWMYDSDLFGVQNPEDGEIGYCCVMGNLGEHFALAVYKGSIGLAGYLALQTGAFGDEPNPMAALFSQSCLMVSFEDREFLSKQDRDVIKSLGLKFRGRNAWTQFRDYTPGYFPWYLTAAQARFLTIALQQAVQVAQRFEQDSDLFDPPADGQYLVRVPEQSDDALVWRDAWIEPAEPEQPEAKIPDPDLGRAAQLKALKSSRAVWEAGVVPSPTPVQEERDQRPYYPLMSLWVEHRSGMVLGTQLSSPQQYRADFQNQFLALIEQAGVRPKEVRVGAAPPLMLLAPLADILGVHLKQANNLPMLEEAYASLAEYFGDFEEEA
jgi:hypothetical protein